MGACKECGGRVVSDGHDNVCSECGAVQGSFYLTGAETPGLQPPQFVHYEEEYKGIAFLRFKQLYHSCTLTLNCPKKITDEGFALLPKLWDLTKSFHFKKKQSMIFALLFHIYRIHNVAIVGRQFLKKAMIDESHFGTAVTFVRELFQFPPYFQQNAVDLMSNNICELVRLVFKKSKPSMESTAQEIALRLAKLICDRDWGNKNGKTYVSSIAGVAVIIAAQYVVACEAGEKAKTDRHTQFKLTKGGTLDYKKVADHVCLHVRYMQLFLKEVQEKLFSIAKEIPWKPKFVTKPLQVALMLPDILDHADLKLADENEEKIDEIDDESSNLTESLFFHHKDAVINAISQYHLSDDTGTDSECSWFREIKFIEILKKELKKSSTHTDLTDERKEFVISATSHSLTVGNHHFSFGQLNLLNDLLLNGCSVEELRIGDYIPLVQKFLETNGIDDDEVIEPLTNEESIEYLK